MVKKAPLALTLLFTFGCGGGGGSTGQITVSGTFSASYVKGVKVCIEGTGPCTTTDNSGRFSLESPTQRPLMSFWLPGVKLGDYQLQNSGETVTPFKIMGNATLGLTLAEIIHGAAGDINGTESRLDFENVTVSANVTSLQEALRSKEPFTLSVKNPQGEFTLNVDPSNATVEACTNGTCRQVSYRKWLVLIYMDGDNSLSSYAREDLKELQAVTYNPQVKVVALTDYAGSTPTQIAVSNEITGKLDITNSTYEPDMGDPQTLESFVKEFTGRFPAPNVALILWNHGDGWRSSKIAAEDATSRDYLFMFELVNALKELRSKGITVNLVGFDECLMGMEEVAYDLKDLTDVTVASEALEPGNGWDYTRVAGWISSNPAATPWEFAKAIVDAYYQTYKDSPADWPLTLTAVSSQQAQQIADNLDTLYGLLSNQTVEQFAAARSNATEVYDSGSYLYHVDLKSFAQALKLTGSDQIKTAAEELLGTLNGTYTAVIPAIDGTTYGGLSVYFPPTLASDEENLYCYFMETPGDCYGQTDYYNPFAQTLWDNFLQTYYQLEGE